MIYTVMLSSCCRRSSNSAVSLSMRMKTITVFYCLLYAAGIEGADIGVEGLEGADVSFQCSHGTAWTLKKYLCRDPCEADEDKLVTVQPGGRVASGRITLVDSGNGVFTVTFSQLQLSDSGRYWCGVDRPAAVDTYHEVQLTVKERKGSFAFSTEASIQTATEAKTDTPAQKSLKDTTLVIIVSVSLALLVFAIIPLIFYRRCWSKAGGQHKAEESADVASTPAAVRLQALEPDAQSESSVHIVTQYESHYQSLDPKALD